MALKVFKCGIAAITKNGSIPGTITAITIRFDAIAYEFSYFQNADYKQIWMNEQEFTVTDVEKVKIGFNK